MLRNEAKLAYAEVARGRKSKRPWTGISASTHPVPIAKKPADTPADNAPMQEPRGVSLRLPCCIGFLEPENADVALERQW